MANELKATPNMYQLTPVVRYDAAMRKYGQDEWLFCARGAGNGGPRLLNVYPLGGNFLRVGPDHKAVT